MSQLGRLGAFYLPNIAIDHDADIGQTMTPFIQPTICDLSFEQAGVRSFIITFGIYVILFSQFVFDKYDNERPNPALQEQLPLSPQSRSLVLVA